MNRRLILAAVVLLLLSACAGGSSDDELLVSAAASLTDAFAEIEVAFEDANPGVDVTLNLAGSSALREQILEGSPVDVFASANTANMDQVAAAEMVDGEVTIFATNSLQIAVPIDNPGEVTGLADFARPELLIGLCAEGVPCGDFARGALARAGVVPSVDTNEPDVRSLLTKVAVGELDAAITYVTDVAGAGGEVRGVDIPDAENVLAEYPIAALDGTGRRGPAERFVDFVLSDDGGRILVGHGFGTP